MPWVLHRRPCTGIAGSHGYRPQPSRTTASSVAPVFRTKMDFGHHQWLGTTLGLSEDSDLTSGLAEYLRQLVDIRHDPSRLIAAGTTTQLLTRSPSIADQWC